MGEVFGSVWWLLVTLGLLVSFHEYGHFVVARRLGVKVLRFSIGFGKPLWSRRGADGTEYVVAGIPLGGYVRMLDEREGEVEPAEAHRAFNRKPVLARIAIVAAGPAFNLIFAVLAFWAMYAIGRSDFTPVVDTPEGIAAEAGLRAGDRIVRIDGDPITSWTAAVIALTERTMAREDVRVAVQGTDGGERERVLPLSTLPSALDEDAALERLGLSLRIPPVIGEFAPDSAAQRAGLRSGDQILAVNGVEVSSIEALIAKVQGDAARDPLLRLRVRRGAETLNVPVQAARATDGSKPEWRIGIGFSAPPRDALLRYGPIAAFGAALRETKVLTTTSLRMLGHLVTGRASLKNVSGPIGIAQSANASARSGVGWFLWFLGVISLSIGILNLLPIPILDGGHLLYYLIELVKGSPVGDRAVAYGQYAGLAILAGLMGLAFYNDILRLVSS